MSHTNIFAAANAGLGVSDCISNYGGTWAGGISLQGYYEQDQGRIVATLWQRPDLYLKNSPVLNAFRITTPLLLMNNKKDAAVSFSQGVELFTALRRLKKKVWMLQYDDGGHSVFGTDAEDYTMRIPQFFEHYLKNAPPPKCMTIGVSAKMKRIDSGLEMDLSGTQP